VKLAHRWGVASLLALIALCVLWEGWLAPLKPGGSWMILKVLPLLLPLRGVLHGRRHAFQWSSMLILAYFTEGVVRAWSEQGMSAWLAGTEVVLSLVYFVAAVGYARDSRSKSIGG
jgi:uncharacterized membrane protein